MCHMACGDLSSPTRDGTAPIVLTTGPPGKPKYILILFCQFKNRIKWTDFNTLFFKDRNIFIVFTSLRIYM